MDSDGNLRQLAINVRIEYSNVEEKVLNVMIGIDRATLANQGWKNDREAEHPFNLPMKPYFQVHREILSRLPRNLVSFVRRAKLCKLEKGFVSRVLERERVSSEGIQIGRSWKGPSLYPGYVED